MEENKRSLSSIIKIVLFILILLIAIFGVSYAGYTWRHNGTLTNQISTDNISLDFLESNDNIISITNALPMTDAEGKIQGDVFDFAVTSKTKKNVSISYTLSVGKLATDTGFTALNDSDIKIYLEDYAGNILLNPTLISNLSNYNFYSGSQQHSVSNETVQDKFKLRVWIDESKTNDAKSWTTSTKLQYKFKVNINAQEQ